MNTNRGSIARQAASRLIFSLGLFVCVVVLSAVTLYRAAIEKAAIKRADDLGAFYTSRLAQQERDWELQTRDYRARLEYSRLLEQPRDMALKLQAFMTVQGSDRRFHYLYIQDGAGRTVFRFGHEPPDWLAAKLDQGTRYFFDVEKAELYRVYQEPIWLGRRGMGRMSLLFRIDHALLGRLAAPGVTLKASYGSRIVASSLGSRGVVEGADSEDAQERSVPLSGAATDAAQLTIIAPVRVLFTPLELGLAASVIPILDALILWFTLGTWLLRQTRRINALEHAVRESSDGGGRASLEYKLREASAGLRDEIDAVAEALRRTTAEREAAEGRIVTLNEELKSHNEQLEVVNGELESFIYSVSHDLRAPLRAIAGYSAIVEEDYGERIDSAGKEFLQRISTNAERMGRRIDDLLYLSKISRQEMERHEVDLSAITASIVAELRERNPERDVEVVIADRITAFADQRLMTVALSNLIANAWKFTQRTPHARIELGGEERDGERVYWVRDNGAGFDPTLAKRMFMPFHRLHSETEFEGTGLGLAIVERVIHRHGGRIWAHGEVDRGATFHFTI